MPFTTTGLSDMLAGSTRPTPVQSHSIPVVRSGSDRPARAQTGTGTTAAFGGSAARCTTRRPAISQLACLEG